MGALEGRVAVITGAGRGIGREHALVFAREGARVVVNDLGGDRAGTGADLTPAQQTVNDIRAEGGEAVVNGDDVSSWEGAHHVIEQAVDSFGQLDVVVNNAGVLRDRPIVTMSEQEWDVVVAVHLKGHMAMTHHAAAYWRERSKDGAEVKASLIHTTSGSGLFGGPSQANYASAKGGILSLSMVCSKELSRYGVRSNAVAPMSRTRLTEDAPGIGEMMAAKPGEHDDWAPSNISPFVAFLAMADCPFNGEAFHVQGRRVLRMRAWDFAEELERDLAWSTAELAAQAEKHLSTDQPTVARRMMPSRRR